MSHALQWAVWDKAVGEFTSLCSIGKESDVRAWVQRKEEWRATQPHCKHEIHPRYEARELAAVHAMTVPEHLADCKRCGALYKLLVQAYSRDYGANADSETGQEHLCDRCGVTACAIHGCPCDDVLCPHGRANLRRARTR